MRGLIAFWSGAIGTIPLGWHLCDGTEGTPNLVNRWIVGAGDTYAVDEVGGALMHTHTIPSWNHRHRLIGGEPISSDGGRKTFTELAVTTYTVWEEYSHPPYHPLYMIMKL